MKTYRLGEKILVCTPSNKASDLIIDKLPPDLLNQTVRVHSSAKYNWDISLNDKEPDQSIKHARSLKSLLLLDEMIEANAVVGLSNMIR